MTTFKTYILCLLASCAFYSAIAGGGWPQPRGKGYFKLYESWITADQHFTNTGMIDPNVTTGLYNTNLYAEYGFTNKFTGIVHIPLFSRATVNNLFSESSGEIISEGDAINGLGDAQIGFKYGLTSGKRISVAPSLTLGIPLGVSEGGREGNLQTGDGEFNQIIRIDAGTGFNSSGRSPVYVNAYAGFNNRTKGYSDEVRIGLEAGISLNDKKLIGIIRLDVVKSLKNGVASGEMLATSTFANNTEFSGIGMELNYKVSKRMGISAG
ncbi:MAG: hypothetical protein ACI9HG_000575, partial [Flavobacteriales bacterium]